MAGKIAKLSAEIAGEKDKIKKAQLELGKKYYDICKENPAEPLKAECDIITYALDAIKTKKVMIEELKKAEPEAEEADFEETAEACAQEEKEEPADEDEPETEDKSEE